MIIKYLFLSCCLFCLCACSSDSGLENVTNVVTPAGEQPDQNNAEFTPESERSRRDLEDYLDKGFEWYRTFFRGTEVWSSGSACEYSSEDQSINYGYFNDSSKLEMLALNNDKYTVFGLSCGMSLKEAEKLLSDRSYVLELEEKDSQSGADKLTYREHQNWTRVELVVSGDTVKRITYYDTYDF